MTKRRAGVVSFAGVLFLVAAAFNIVDGLVALARPHYFVVGENGTVIKDYTAFGVVLLIVAGVQVLVGWGILARARSAQIIGVALAIINAVIELAYFRHYPAWSVIILILDAVIIYALTVHGDEFS